MSLLYQIANVINIDMYRCVCFMDKIQRISIELGIRPIWWWRLLYMQRRIGNGGSFVSTVYLGTVVRFIQFVSGVW